ncbi:MAG: GNAT family N-acetyltransferase [Anaerolineales bacterium]
MMASAKNDRRRPGTIWALNLDEPRTSITPLLDVSFRQIGPESVSLLTGMMGDNARAEILRRFETGRRCYIGSVDDQLAAYGWVSLNEEYLGELDLRVRLLPGEAYIWDCFTLPAFRRKGFYSALLTHIVGELQADQLCRVWIGADSDNKSSQDGIARAGFHMVANMIVARVFAMRLVWVQGRPDISESLIAEVRRAFLDDRDRVWLAAVEKR